MSVDRQGYRDPLGGVCGGTRGASPTPRQERPVQTTEKDGGPWREENKGSVGHQGRARQSVTRQAGHPPAVGEVLRQSAQHQVSRTLTFYRREGTTVEEGTTAAAAGAQSQIGEPVSLEAEPTYAETL